MTCHCQDWVLCRGIRMFAFSSLTISSVPIKSKSLFPHCSFVTKFVRYCDLPWYASNSISDVTLISSSRFFCSDYTQHAVWSEVRLSACRWISEVEVLVFLRPWRYRLPSGIVVDVESVYWNFSRGTVDNCFCVAPFVNFFDYFSVSFRDPLDRSMSWLRLWM